MRLFSLAGDAVLLFTLLVVASAGAAPAPRWQDCHMDGIAEPARCVAFEVPVNWQSPDGAQITLHATVVPALDGRAAPDPLVVLAGGPGQAAGDYGALVATAFEPLRRERDVVLLDQRGTGRSAGLRCEFGIGPFEAIDIGEMPRAVRACMHLATFDLRFLSSMEAVRDIERLRELLGAAQLNLWGGSFGTRLAQHYVRAFPGRVRSVVLDAALPADAALFETAPATSQAAWQRLVESCGRDAACANAFPDLERAFAALLQRLDQQPETAALTDPTTGYARTITVDRVVVTEAVRGALYVPGHAAVLPYAITRALDGDYATLAALSHTTAAWAGDTMYVGATLGILCSEAVPRLDAGTARRAGLGTFVRDSYYRLWQSACAAWPERQIDSAWLAPLRSDVPALILSGATDPVTPPRLGELAALGFAPATHAVAPHGGHTISALGCAPELIADFVASPLAAGIDTDCLATSIPPVPFTLGALGPVAMGVSQ